MDLEIVCMSPCLDINLISRIITLNVLITPKGIDGEKYVGGSRQGGEGID